MERKPMVKPRRRDKKSADSLEYEGKGQALGKVPVERKALKIQDLSDKVGFAVKQFEAAQHKFERGEDSYGEWKNIIKLLNRQIKDVQQFLAMAHHNMGIIHAGKGEFGDAMRCFNEAIDINPEYGMAYYNLAVVHKKMGDTNMAKKFLAKAREKGYPPRSQDPRNSGD